MIKVSVASKEDQIMSVKITGHALSADPGQDLVCAAVSAIGTGTLNALDLLAQDDYELTLIDTEEPVIEIKTQRTNEKGSLIIEVMLIQLKTIQEINPEFISIQTN